MVLNFYSSVDVSCDYVWSFVTLSGEDVVMEVRDTLFNCNLNSLRFLFNLVTLAAFASIFFLHDLTLPFTSVTLSLTLGVHSGAQLDELLDNTSALALGTLGDILASLAITFDTVSISVELDLFHTAVVHFVEGDFDLDKFWLGLFGASVSLAPSTEEAEHISEPASPSWSATVLNTFLSIVIIELSLFGVGESLVDVGQLFELIGVSSLIGVLLHGFLPEGLPDLL